MGSGTEGTWRSGSFGKFDRIGRAIDSAESGSARAQDKKVNARAEGKSALTKGSQNGTLAARTGRFELSAVPYPSSCDERTLENTQ